MRYLCESPPSTPTSQAIPGRTGCLPKSRPMKAFTASGEGTLNYFGKTIEAAIHELKPLVLGMDPFQVEIISQRLDPRCLFRRRADPHVRRGRHRDRLLGHHRQSLQSADLQPVGRPLPREAARLCQRLVPRTAHAGELCRESQGRRRARLYRAQVRSVRQRLAQPVALRFRPLGGHHPRRARCRGPFGRSADRRPLPLQRRHRNRVCRSHPPVPPGLVRGACPHTNIPAMVEVARRSPVPIATGESLPTSSSLPSCSSTRWSASCSPSR